MDHRHLHQSRGATDTPMAAEDYRLLIENVPAVVYRCLPTAEWPMVFISGFIADLVGWPASDFVGPRPKRAYASVIHPEDRRAVEDNVFAAINERRHFVLEYRVITSTGKVRWVIERGRGVHDECGGIAYLDGAIMDVTDRKQAEDEVADWRGLMERAADRPMFPAEGNGTAASLREKTEEIDAVFENSQDILTVCTMDNVFRRVSPAAKTILGYCPDELVGRRADSIAHPDDRDVLKRVAAVLRERGEHGPYVVRFRRKDGTYRVIETRARADGQRIVSVSRDITDELDLAKAVKDGQEKFRTVFESSPQGLAVLSLPDGRCLDVNPAMLKNFRLERHECLGKTVTEVGIVPPWLLEDAQAMSRDRWALRQEKVTCIRKDGEEIIGYLTTEPIETSRGPLMLLVWDNRVPTEKKEEK